ALMRMQRAVGEQQVDRNLRLRAVLFLELPGEPEVFGLGDPRFEEDGIDDGNRDEQCVLAAADEVAGLHLRRADESIDRSRDARITKIELRFVEACLRRGHLRTR